MNVNTQPHDETALLQEKLAARRTVEARFKKFGVGDEDCTWIMENLADEVISSLMRLDHLKPTLGELQSTLTMFDEEAVGVAFFLNNPALVSGYIKVAGEELKKSQRVLALGAIFSDLGKVTGEGEMTWLYDNFYFHGEAFHEELEIWKKEPGHETERKNVGLSPMLLPWEKAKEIYKKVYLGNGETDHGSWNTNAVKFEQKMKSLGWDLSQDPELTFGEVMTRAHLQELANQWEKLAQNLNPDIADDVKVIALNHHLVSGFPVGKDNFLQSLGSADITEIEPMTRVKECLLSQLSDAIIASVCRQRRSGDEFHTQGMQRMLADLITATKKWRIPTERMPILLLWVEELPKDSDKDPAGEMGAVEAGVREILGNGLSRSE